PMVVAGDFYQHVDLDQWHILFDPVNQTPKPFTRVFKGEGWTDVKTLMASKQRWGNETSNMRLLSDVDAYIEGFMGQHRQGLQFRMFNRFHEPFPRNSIPAHCRERASSALMSKSLPSRSRLPMIASPVKGGIACSCSSLPEILLSNTRKPQAHKMLDGPLALLVGWRSKVPWTCLCQLRIRSQTSKLVSGVRTHPSACSQGSSPKGEEEFCGTCTKEERPLWASPLPTVYRFRGDCKLLCSHGIDISIRRRRERTKGALSAPMRVSSTSESRIDPP